MGMPNMDFVVRENRAVVRGQMAIVRLGTCGAVQRPAKLGDLLIAAHGSIGIRRDPDYWTLAHQHEQEQEQQAAAAAGHAHQQHHAAGNGAGAAAAANGNGSAAGAAAGGLSYSYGSGAAAGARPYMVSLPVPADDELAALLTAEATAVVGAGRVVQGLNASADSFYSSQGRTGSDFDDCNAALLGELAAAHPDLVSLEMETFQLLDLARCSRGSIKAAGMCVALAERYSNAFLEYSKLEELEIAGGTAALKALVRCRLTDGNTPAASMGEDAGPVEYVWA
ncbi:hypothetical protein HXX76_004495 [Chlamydomonas incerta]|uniref:Nucleoside phosphorylase domain-containing protein n=1 Tax=Chlamydomonas incerta TaxID=51695 RepID=A0A835T9U9_CHLIN|nr:hypothetical protein HXX76_004495 [Chlamydomonas incerta]|eukprot:KAG2439128.1 hypothetical protein HXX76_004495 [Chlamydomonas incerta]